MTSFSLCFVIWEPNRDCETRVQAWVQLRVSLGLGTHIINVNRARIMTHKVEGRQQAENCKLEEEVREAERGGREMENKREKEVGTL